MCKIKGPEYSLTLNMAKVHIKLPYDMSGLLSSKVMKAARNTSITCQVFKSQSLLTVRITPEDVEKDEIVIYVVA
jgi:hypothetical protein